MIDNVREWSANERKTGQRVADAWQEFFHVERKDAIERMEEISETARIAEVQAKHESQLLAMENVVGVAASLKITAGKPTKKWSVTVLVETVGLLFAGSPFVTIHNHIADVELALGVRPVTAFR